MCAKRSSCATRSIWQSLGQTQGMVCPPARPVAGQPLTYRGWIQVQATPSEHMEALLIDVLVEVLPFSKRVDRDPLAFPRGLGSCRATASSVPTRMGAPSSTRDGGKGLRS
jgi:hypothetical protein